MEDEIEKLKGEIDDLKQALKSVVSHLCDDESLLDHTKEGLIGELDMWLD